MNFKVNIKPTVYNGHGTSNSAIDKFYRVVPAATFFILGKHGNYYGPVIRKNDGSPDYAYCYNMEIFKRGKHRKNKHFTLYVYKIDLRLLDILGLKINQHHMNFQIVSNKK